MTSITGPTLRDLKADYHGILSRLLLQSAEESVLFSHFGDINQSKTEQILNIAQASILEQGDKRQAMKRICSVLIEALQNIGLHAAHDSSGHMYAYCIITRGDDYYRLLTGNLILSEDVESLRSKMRDITAMDKNALRKQFIETLCNEDFTFKGGAGLGLLTIAKRAQSDLEYAIRTLSSDFGYFQLETTLAVEG
jgi:anti-sigma regulatory factor (Ser/Thr protein kinase)